MKILLSLIGLILFLAGIYLTYWVYLDFESFETLYLGLYLSGSFVLMTLGFYLFLLPLALKPKKLKVDINKSFNQLPTEKIDDQSTEISSTDAIKIIQDDEKEISLINLSEEIKQSTFFEDDVDNAKIIEPNKPIIEKIPFREETSEAKQFSMEEIYDIVELRVIGIESWTSQGILRKLTQDNHLELSQKIKSGITMNQICYKQKLIGYIPRLDMNKINHKLDRLVVITPSNIIKDGRKIIHFSINLKFKYEDKTNE